MSATFCVLYHLMMIMSHLPHHTHVLFPCDFSQFAGLDLKQQGGQFIAPGGR
jgi:hypothetical protein